MAATGVTATATARMAAETAASTLAVIALVNSILVVVVARSQRIHRSHLPTAEALEVGKIPGP